MKQTLSALALKHEAFVLALLSGMSAADAARKAGYGRKNINVRILAWELLQRSDIQDRLKELIEATTDETVLSVLARKQVLSQIARARLSDYRDEYGVIRPLDKDVPNPSAIASVEYAYDSVKREPYPVRISLRDPVNAIMELCKLDGSYKKPGVSVAVAPIVTVSVEKTRSKIKQIVEEHQTEDVPPLGEGKQEEASG